MRSFDRDDSLADVWFNPASALARLEAPSRPPGVGAAPHPFDALRSGLVAALGGTLGAMVSLATADGVAHSHRLASHVRIALGQAPALGSVTATTVREWVGIAALAGAILGGGFGALMRRLVPVVARVLFGATVSAALCTLLYAFVLLRLAPALAGSIPFASCVVGALVYGACLGLVPPIRRALRFGDDDETPSLPPGLPSEALAPSPARLRSTPLPEHQSFPLVRKRPVEWDRA